MQTKRSVDIAWDRKKIELFDVYSVNEFAQKLTVEPLGVWLDDRDATDIV